MNSVAALKSMYPSGFRTNYVNPIDQIRLHRLIPVLAITSAINTLPLAELVLDGDVSIMEIIFRTPEAIQSISIIRENYLEALIGAGTVTALEQAIAPIEL